MNIAKRTYHPRDVKLHAVRKVLEVEREHASRWSAVKAISEEIGVVPETLHGWVKKLEHEIMTETENKQIEENSQFELIKRLEAEIRQLKKENEALIDTIAVFAAMLKRS